MALRNDWANHGQSDISVPCWVESWVKADAAEVKTTKLIRAAPLDTRQFKTVTNGESEEFFQDKTKE